MRIPNIVKVEEIVPDINVNGIVRTEDLAQGILPVFGKKVHSPELDGGKDDFSSRKGNRRDFGEAHSLGFAEDLLLNDEYRRDLSRLKDQVVVDLGAGELPDGYLIALASGARGYIGVEPFYADMLIKRLVTPASPEFDKRSPTRDCLISRAKMFNLYGNGLASDLEWDNFDAIPASVVGEDARTFLERLPDNSVSILSCGTCDIVTKNEKYTEDVDEHLRRVLHPEGDYVGWRSIWGIGINPSKKGT